MLALSACGGAQDGAASHPPQLLATAATTSFGASALSGLITVDSGAGLVFKVKESNGDIVSIRYKGGPELNDTSKASHISSGISAPTTFSVADGVIKLTLTTPTLTHYLLVREGDNTIYMGTYVTAEPTVGELRWITRLKGSVFTNVPPDSYIANNSGNIESSDVVGLPNGETRSKYFGNQRAMDLTLRGVTGAGVGAFMVYGNRESSSGGPFYNDIQNQSGTDSEVYNYMNSGHNQTEPWRMGFHGPYALVFTDGDTPALPDMGWMEGQNLAGWVAKADRGSVQGAGLTDMNPAYAYTVGFKNAAAQYWARADPVSGAYTAPDMKPGTYTLTVFKGEYAVATDSVTVGAGLPTSVASKSVANDPSNVAALWRIGDWDGTPLEFLNSERLRRMHPSDVRHSPWVTPAFVVGSSNPATDFSPYQWRDINNNVVIKFNLKRSQLVPLTLRVGITVAQAGGRPKPLVNGWAPANPVASSQPDSRSITLGSFRGNNTMYSFKIPASELVIGENTIVLSPISGSSGAQYLSPAYAYDAVDLIKTP